ncbi:hypothetical protein BDN70DRAFT_890426 [Pholiota conissans]|uniref:Uncharacterized protein n=1 Tax=Pholiota conissans TaxID=109636 RepID=A0A9P5ZCN5_9AGAR|nr:hypothetical protein BDN70DRAFT_890426 [Pholiota conissans]
MHPVNPGGPEICQDKKLAFCRLPSEGDTVYFWVYVRLFSNRRLLSRKLYQFRPRSTLNTIVNPRRRRHTESAPKHRKSTTPTRSWNSTSVFILLPAPALDIFPLQSIEITNAVLGRVRILVTPHHFPLSATRRWLSRLHLRYYGATTPIHVSEMNAPRIFWAAQMKLEALRGR